MCIVDTFCFALELGLGVLILGVLWVILGALSLVQVMIGKKKPFLFIATGGWCIGVGIVIILASLWKKINFLAVVPYFIIIGASFYLTSDAIRIIQAETTKTIILYSLDAAVFCAISGYSLLIIYSFRIFLEDTAAAAAAEAF